MQQQIVHPTEPIKRPTGLGLDFWLGVVAVPLIIALIPFIIKRLRDKNG